MAANSMFTVGYYDPFMSDRDQQLMRQDTKFSYEQQKKYDQWKAGLDYNYDWKRTAELFPFQYETDLSTQLANLGSESALRNQRAIAAREALEAAGYNPLLAVDNVAGSQSASPLIAGALNGHSAASHGNASLARSDNTIIHGGSESLMDFINKIQSLRLTEAEIEDVEARADVSRSSAAKIKKETDLVGYENPTRTLKSVADSWAKKAPDVHPISSAKQFIDDVKTLHKGEYQPDSGTTIGLSSNLKRKMENAGIPVEILTKEQALRLYKEYNDEKKKAK